MPVSKSTCSGSTTRPHSPCKIKSPYLADHYAARHGIVKILTLCFSPSVVVVSGGLRVEPQGFTTGVRGNVDCRIGHNIRAVNALACGEAPSEVVHGSRACGRRNAIRQSRNQPPRGLTESTLQQIRAVSLFVLLNRRSQAVSILRRQQLDGW